MRGSDYFRVADLALFIFQRFEGANLIGQQWYLVARWWQVTLPPRPSTDLMNG